MCEHCETIGGDTLWYLNPMAHAWRNYRLKERIYKDAKLTKATMEIDWEPFTKILPLKETDPELFEKRLEGISEHIGAMSKMQVVPLQDVEKMLEISGMVTKLNCVCRLF